MPSTERKYFYISIFPTQKDSLSVGCVKLSLFLYELGVWSNRHTQLQKHIGPEGSDPPVGSMLGRKPKPPWPPNLSVFLSLLRPSCEHSVFIAAVVVLIGCFYMIWHFSGGSIPIRTRARQAECHYVENGCYCEAASIAGDFSLQVLSIMDSFTKWLWMNRVLAEALQVPTLYYKTECPCNGCSGEVEMRAGGWERSHVWRHRQHSGRERNVSPTGKRTSMDPTNLKGRKIIFTWILIITIKNLEGRNY